jgi:hypothetical protein
MIGINFLVNPFSPSRQSPHISIQGFESWMHMISFLIIIFSVTISETSTPYDYYAHKR